MASPSHKYRLSGESLDGEQIRQLDEMLEDLYSYLTASPLGTSTADFDLSSLLDLSTTDGQVLRRSGGVVGFGAVDLTDSDAVTGPLPVTKGGSGTATAFTQGRIVFAGASGVYSQDAGLFWDASTSVIKLTGGLRIADGSVGNIYLSNAGRGITFVTTPLTDAFDANHSIVGTAAGGIEITTLNDSLTLIGNTGTATTKPMFDIRAYDAATSNDTILAIRLKGHAAAVAANGLGSKILFQASSSTTNYRDQATVESLWVDVTDATRTGAVAIKLVVSAATLAEVIRFTAAGITLSTGNGENVGVKSLTELTTVAAAAFTDTTIQFPANSVPLGVSVRVTTVIPTAATFDVGDPTTPTLYNAALSTAATTTGKNGPSAHTRYTAATSVRLTPNLVPGANTGRVRVTLHYIDFTAPTS